MASNESQSRCFHIFYTKDVHKKKKVYKQGVLLLSVNNNVKIFDQDGQIVTSFKNKQQIQANQEYIANNYLISIDRIGDIKQFNTGSIFTKKQIILLPIKKKLVTGLNKDSKTKIDDLVKMECGLYMQKKLFDILRPHQREGVQFMHKCISGKTNENLKGCILADFMGLGKTLQTLALAYSMIRQKQIKKVVIVCPLTLLDVWQKQTKKWLQQKIIPLVCHGDGTATTNTVKSFVSQQYRMLVISYETFYKNIQKISGKCDLIIFDEGHRLKNKKSKLLLKMKAFRCEKRILLTGTPIQNNLQELYTCISIINPRMFGSQSVFRNVFQKPIIDGLGKKATLQQKKLAKQRTFQLSRQLKQFSLRRTADILKKFLPPRNEHLIFMKLTPLQKIWYQRIVNATQDNEEDMFRTLNYLRKLFIHPSILKMKKINNGECQNCLQDCNQQISPKIQFTLKVLQQCVVNQQKCVVVSYFTETLDFIGKILKQKNIRYSKLDGRLKGEQRKLAVKKFESQFPVLLLSGKAGGTGLTLTCAVKMIMIEPDWNPSNDSQVMGRIWRQGQQNEVHIYRLLIASTFEQKILQRQGLKKTLANNLIDNENSQKGDGVDLENLGKLFVKYKQQVMTYMQKQNQIAQFIEQNQHFFDNNLSNRLINNGVVFVKSSKSTSQQNNNNLNEQETNQFNNLQLQHFTDNKDGKRNQNTKQSNQDLDQQEQDNYDQEDSQQIQKIQKIQKIIVNNKNKANDVSIENTSLKDSQIDKWSTQSHNQQEVNDKNNNESQYQTKIDEKDENQSAQRINKEINNINCERIISSPDNQIRYNQLEQKIIVNNRNSKLEIINLGPQNVLKKIKKKQ